MLKNVYQLYLVSALVFLLSPSAFAADLNIAFLNDQNAILASNRAKDFEEELRQELEIELNSVKLLREDLTELQEELKRDDAILSESERQRLQSTIRSKGVRFEAQARALQQIQQERLEGLLEEMRPAVTSVVNDLIAVEGYDAILRINPQNTLYVNPIRDITRKVTSKLNEKLQ